MIELIGETKKKWNKFLTCWCTLQDKKSKKIDGFNILILGKQHFGYDKFIFILLTQVDKEFRFECGTIKDWKQRKVIVSTRIMWRSIWHFVIKIKKKKFWTCFIFNRNFQLYNTDKRTQRIFFIFQKIISSSFQK